MALMERVTTLLRANLNDLVDKAEDPEKMLKQLVLDMENQLLQVKTQVAIAIADQHLLEKKTAEHEEAAATVGKTKPRLLLPRAATTWRGKRWSDLCHMYRWARVFSSSWKTSAAKPKVCAVPFTSCSRSSLKPVRTVIFNRRAPTGS